MSAAAEIRSHPTKLRRWTIVLAAIVAVSLPVVTFLREVRRHGALLQFKSVGMWIGTDSRSWRSFAPTGFVEVQSALPEFLQTRLADEILFTWFVRVRLVDVSVRDTEQFEEALSVTGRFPELESLRLSVRDWKPQYWDRIESLTAVQEIHLVTDRIDESFNRLRHLPRLRGVHLQAHSITEGGLQALEQLRPGTSLALAVDGLEKSRSVTLGRLRRRTHLTIQKPAWHAGW